MYQSTVEVLSTLSSLERECLKLLISNACKAEFASKDPRQVALESTLIFKVNQLISLIRSKAAAESVTGMIFKGFFPDISESVLAQLRAEARERRISAEIVDRQFSVKGGAIALELAKSLDFRSISLPGGFYLDSTGYANYAYYEKEGMGIAPHIDSSEYPVNAILSLSHEYDESSECDKSALVIFDKHLNPIPYVLAPGELIVFHGESFIHYRQPLAQRESLTILAFGLEVKR